MRQINPAIRIAVVGELLGMRHEIIEERAAYLGHRGIEILKVTVEQAVRHACPLGNILDAKTVEAFLIKRCERRSFQKLPRAQRTRLYAFFYRTSRTPLSLRTV